MGRRQLTHLKSLGDGKFYDLETIIKIGREKNLKYRVGVDSLDVRGATVYIISLVGIYPEKRGAAVWFYREKVSPRIKNIHDRLWKEAEAAVDFASLIRDKYKANVDAVEFDFNVDPQYFSSRLSSSAIGLAKLNGFNGLTKPSDLYGIAVSDHITHRYGKKRNAKIK